MLLQKLSRAEMAAKSWLPLFALHLLLFKVNNAHDRDAWCYARFTAFPSDQAAGEAFRFAKSNLHKIPNDERF
jgi:hypothetical protein